ncbi:24345_t:CDS:2, partial [Gigaspora margarita]
LTESGLQNEEIRNAAITVSTLWKELGHSNISLSQANCERTFSTLKWFVDELTYFDAELTKSEFREMVKLATIDNDIDDCLDDHIVDEVNENNNTYEGNLSLLFQNNLILEDF